MTPTQNSIYEKISETTDEILKKYSIQPQVGIILGSGLGGVSDLLEERVSIPYAELPHFYPTTIDGHEGRMVLGKMKGVSVVILQGRFHLYEGHSMEDIVFPLRVLCKLGIHTAILTNAAGGINTRFRPGDLMIIEDHLNLMSDNPLKGPNLSKLGPRFTDLSEPYSKECIEIMNAAGAESGIPLHKGVYVGLAGPTYETPAEVRMLRLLGGDAVGMSTVPECIAANHIGIRVAGISFISNLAAGLTPHKLNHQEVIDLGKEGAEKIKKLLGLAIPRIASQKRKTP